MMSKLKMLQPTNGRTLYAFLVLAFFALAYLLPLGVRDLLVPDETRYGEIPREMIVDGDWVAPHLNGVRYFEKPALGYWVHAGSILLFGQNNFAVRFPSVLAAGLSALLIFVLIRRMSRNAGEQTGLTAILASLVFLSCFEVFAVGNTAVLDNIFAFFLTATIAAFYFASEAQPRSAQEKRFLLLAGLACGLAFMTKGFLAFVVPVVVIAPYLVWQHRSRDVLRMSWLPLLTAVLVALPWGIMIHLQQPDFWNFFFWNEHVRRFMADDAQHKQPFWFFIMLAPVIFFPWTFVIPAAVAGVKERLTNQGPLVRLIKFSICWLVLPFLFFSCASGKLLTYILPCFPPFAILVAIGLTYILNKKERRTSFHWGVLGSALFFALLLLAFVYVQFFADGDSRPYSAMAQVVMVISAFTFPIFLCFGAFWSQNGNGKILLLGMTPLLLFFSVHFVIPDESIEKKAPGPFLERHAQDIARDTIIISDDKTVGAACWYLQRSDVYVLGRPGELEYGLGHEDAAGRLLDAKSATDLINRNRGRAVLIVSQKSISEYRNEIPKPVSQDDSGLKGYVFWEY